MRACFVLLLAWAQLALGSAPMTKALYLTKPQSLPLSDTMDAICTANAPPLCVNAYYDFAIAVVGVTYTLNTLLVQYEDTIDAGPVRFWTNETCATTTTCAPGYTCFKGFCHAPQPVDAVSYTDWITNGPGPFFANASLPQHWVGNSTNNCAYWTLGLLSAGATSSNFRAQPNGVGNCSTASLPILCMCTWDVPKLIDVELSADAATYGQIVVSFDSLTDKAGTLGGAASAFNCSLVIGIQPVPRAWAEASCYFALTDASTLYVNLGPNSNLSVTASYFVYALASIKSADGFDYLGANPQITVPITFPVTDGSSPPWLDGPRTHPTCNPNLTLSVYADNSAGRVYTKAVLQATPALKYAVAVNPSTLGIQIPSSYMTVGQTYTFSVVLTNWMNLTQTTNAIQVANVLFTELAPVAEVTYAGGNQPRSQSQLDPLTLTGNVYVDALCLAGLPVIEQNLFKLAYTWEVFAMPAGTWPASLPPAPLVIPKLTLVSTDTLSLVSLDLISLRNASQFIAFRVNATGGASIAGGRVLGSASILVTLADLPLRVVLNGPTQLQFESNQLASFDTLKSCDPNTQGVLCGGPPNFNVQFQVWYYDPTQLAWLPVYPSGDQGDFDGMQEPFTIVANVTVNQVITFNVSQLVVAGIYRVVAFPSSDASAQVVQPFYVLTDAASCSPPLINMPVLASSVTVPNYAPFVIQPMLAASSPGTGSTTFTWYIGNDVVPASMTPFSNRINLALFPGVILGGASYTFRLVAQTQGCSVAFTGEVTVNVNAPPTGGALAVTPSVGQAFNTTFRLEASLFVDTDLPLSYYFSLSQPGVVNDVRLNAMSTNWYLDTRLASTGTTAVVITTCVDALGAAAPASANVTVQPLYVPGVSLCAALPDANATSALLRRTASLDDAMRALIMLASAATDTFKHANVTGDEAACLQAWRTNVSVVLIMTVEDTMDTEGLDLNELSLFASALASALSGQAANLPGDILLLAAQELQTLIEFALVASAVDPLAQLQGVVGLFSDATAGSLFDALSGLVTSLRVAPGAQPPGAAAAASRRALAALRGSKATESPTSVVQADLSNAQDALLDAIKAICSAALTGFIPGCPALTVQGELITCTITRETRVDMGSADGVNELAVPGGSGGGPVVNMPPGMLANQSQLVLGGTQAPPDTIDIAFCHLKFNLHELVTAANPPPGGAHAQGVLANFTVEECFTLLFLGEGNSSVTVDPKGLQSTINITIPLQAGFVAPKDNTTATVCGAWDDSFGGWGVTGCTVLEVDYDAGTLVCACNHASDFTAWNAFVRDLNSAGDGLKGTPALIAIVTVCVLVPVIAAVWLLLLFLGWRKDSHDAANIQLGALVLLTKNKLRQRMIQKRFFKMLRNNAKNSAGASITTMDHDALRRMHLSKAEENALLRHKTLRWWERCMPDFLSGFVRALVYEHSVFGAFNRFDPWYTRTQRFTVLAAVVVGNLFAASFFFALKTANNVSAGFFIGQVLLASVVITLPVRVLIRWLFRSTPPSEGGTLDQVVAIYRISEKNADLLPGYALRAEQADLEIVLALKNLHLAKGDVIKLEKCGGDLSRMPGMSDVTSTTSARMGRLSKSANYAEALASARATVEDAASVLRAKCETAKLEWTKVPKRASARVDTLRRQQSTVMKVAALMYDEADSRAKPKPWHCAPNFIYFAWALLFLYLVAGLGYSVYWVLEADSAVRANAYVKAQQTAEYEYELVPPDPTWIVNTWLLTAGLGVLVGLFVIEPCIQFLRFGIMASCLQKCGRGTSLSQRHDTALSADTAVAIGVPQDAKVEDAAVQHKGSGGMRLKPSLKAAKVAPTEGATASGFEVLADLIQNIA